jgi:hypothetical protein
MLPGRLRPEGKRTPEASGDAFDLSRLVMRPSTAPVLIAPRLAPCESGCLPMEGVGTKITLVLVMLAPTMLVGSCLVA